MDSVMYLVSVAKQGLFDGKILFSGLKWSGDSGGLNTHYGTIRSKISFPQPDLNSSGI